MSAFLGPIHYWLFNKIKFQNEETEKIVDYFNNKYPNLNLKKTLNEKFNALEDLPLEDIINTNNIHGWLQERVSLVEYRFAYAIAYLLKENGNYMEEIEDLSFKYGKDHNASHLKSADLIFKYLSDTLLDGMPCDRANEIISHDETVVKWKRNLCVHKPYWDEIGENVEIYYLLRDKLIEGILDGSKFSYEKSDDNIYSIKEVQNV